MKAAAGYTDPQLARPSATKPGPSSLRVGRPAMLRWRVLIADNHAPSRQTIRTILESYLEIEVTAEVSDGEEAVRQAERLRPDLILMDVNLPRKNGIEATQQIKRLLPNIVILGISADYTSQNYNAMIAAGAVAFLRKEDAADVLFKTIVYTMFTYSPSHPS